MKETKNLFFLGVVCFMHYLTAVLLAFTAMLIQFKGLIQTGESYDVTTYFLFVIPTTATRYVYKPEPLHYIGGIAFVIVTYMILWTIHLVFVDRFPYHFQDKALVIHFILWLVSSIVLIFILHAALFLSIGANSISLKYMILSYLLSPVTMMICLLIGKRKELDKIRDGYYFKIGAIEINN